METIERIWKKDDTSTYLFWDLGNEIWDFDSQGECRHYRMEKRDCISKEPIVIKETLRPLPFTPVPLEAIQKKCFGWNVSCKQASAKVECKKITPEVSHHQPTKSLEVSSTEDDSPKIKTANDEIWVSLSQWIPSYALYQPSLHKQASMEMNETIKKVYTFEKKNLFSVDKPLFI